MNNDSLRAVAVGSLCARTSARELWGEITIFCRGFFAFSLLPDSRFRCVLSQRTRGKCPDSGSSATGAGIPYGETRTGRFAEFGYYPVFGGVMCDGVTLTMENKGVASPMGP